jgi:hypothetical protein
MTDIFVRYVTPVIKSKQIEPTVIEELPNLLVLCDD